MEAWLTGLLVRIITPIIDKRITELENFILKQVARKEVYEKYDREAQELTEKMAKASTSEERWAILQEIKNARPKSLGH